MKIEETEVGAQPCKTVQFHVVFFPAETITVNIGAELAWKILIG
jgi:hypothetical protein